VFLQKRLQAIENKGKERGKEHKETSKRLQASENMGFATPTRSGKQRDGDTEAPRKRRHPHPRCFL
jgi:hypothetical protein